MRILFLSVVLFCQCEICVSQVKTPKILDKVFTLSFGTGSHLQMKINNCTDSLLNKVVISQLLLNKEEFRHNFDLSIEDLSEFTCTAAIDSTFLNNVRAALNQIGVSDDRIVVGSILALKGRNAKIMDLRLFSKKKYDRYLKNLAKLRRKISHTPDRYKKLYKKTTNYILISTSHGVSFVGMSNNGKLRTGGQPDRSQ